MTDNSVNENNIMDENASVAERFLNAIAMVDNAPAHAVEQLEELQKHVAALALFSSNEGAQDIEIAVGHIPGRDGANERHPCARNKQALAVGCAPPGQCAEDVVADTAAGGKGLRRTGRKGCGDACGGGENDENEGKPCHDRQGKNDTVA